MKSIINLSTFLLLIGVLFYFSCKKEYSCENCIGTNQLPIANAGSDRVITLPIDSVSLDGSASNDPDGTISSFLWTKISGPAFFIINNASAARTFVKNLAAGTYQFELKVTDNGGLSAKDTMRIIVDSVLIINHPPVANAGADQAITLPTNTVTFDASGSTDPDNNITDYVWAKISGPTSFNIANANVVQTQITNLVQGVYQFELKVTDAGGLFSKDTMQVIVNPASSTNLPPVANAGTDISVNYDLQTCSTNPSTITLNGSASTDPDGTIISYLWTGPGVIANPNSAITQVSNLIPGANEFTLLVTDNNGAANSDLVVVNVVNLLNRPLINAQLVPFGTLSQARMRITIGTAGNKILFAGGISGAGPQFSSRVDIYDINTNVWSTAELSQARFDMVSVTLGNKIYFAGGFGGSTTSRIDIYDASTNTWSSSELSIGREYVAAAVAGNKVFFAGGYSQTATGPNGFNNRVDIYDASMDSWSTASLSVPRGGLSASAVGNKVYFAGGSTGDITDMFPVSQIDIYDAVSNSWITSSLSEPKQGFAGIAVDNKIYWSGGDNDLITSNLVEIRDVNTQTSSFTCLFQPSRWYMGEFQSAAQKNDKIVFFIGQGGLQNKFDVYDITNNTWSIGVLSMDIPSNGSIFSFNSNIYVAGYANDVFSLSNQVWKLEF